MPKPETPSFRLGGCVRCAICGNENAETNYFCGMCGAALSGKAQRPVQPVAPAPTAPRPVPPAPPSTQRQAAPLSRTEAPLPSRAAADSYPEQDSAPVITGPSFLGLSAPAPRSGPRESGRDNSLSRDSRPHDQLQHSTRNLDYLLEDEEEPKRGWGKLIVVFVALALALGFGYLRWKQGGFDWLTGTKNPAAVAPATPASQGSSADSTRAPASTPNAATGVAATPPATTLGQGSSAPTADSSTPATTPASGGTMPAESAAPLANSPQTNSPQTTPAQTSSAQSGSADANPSTDSTSPSSAQPSDSNSDAKPSPVPATVKPRQPKPTPAKPLDVVTEAERFIYGRGIHQDCDHGLRMLKSTADQSNPRAMISLGALYTTGTCTPRDLPTAYRWFALALHKDPNNQALQDDLQQLWSQMTPPERQLAIKLSQ